jgi:type I restriction enzyme S subunit
MIADLKAYADYKDTGLPWLGQVPGHWEIKRGKSYLTVIDERSKTGKEELLTVSSARGVVPRRTTNVTMFKAESYTGHKLCWPDDLVVNSLWAWAGGLGVSEHHGIISTAYSVYRARRSAGINPRFLHELVRSSAYQWELQVRSKGVWISRLQLTDTAFLDSPIPLPPPAEQAAIVRFLDWANGRLERAIRAKRKVIALLNEQKQAIIHRAVTRGLDPSVPLKPSGIPWVGEIPEHWEVVRTKNVCRIQGGFAFKTEWFKAEGIPVIRMSNLRRGDLDISEAVRVGGEHCLSDYQLSEGDILYGLSGSIGSTGSLGNFAVVRQSDLPAQLNQRVARFRPNKSTVACDFLVLLLQTSVFYEQVLSDTTGTAQFNVSTNDVGRVAFALPSLTEQVRIVSSVAEAISPLNITTSRLEGEIALLREYRTRLVADVVTGKLDVREAATRLPDEVLLPDLAAADEERDDMPIEEEADA